MTIWIWNAATGRVEAELKGHTNSVTSVAFSWDGSRVVSGSYDLTVRIWNATTGVSQVMTTPTFTLPDFQSVVYCTSSGKFHIVYPRQPIRSQAIMISHDRPWIVGPHRDCWIPPHYCHYSASSISGGRACLGQPSGHVVIFDMTTEP